MVSSSLVVVSQRQEHAMIVNFESHASNERTFLAWVRTAVSTVGFGLAAARLADQAAPLWAEALMLSAGSIVIAVAWLRMRHVRYRIDNPDRLPDDSTLADLFLLLLVLALFILLGTFVLNVS